MLNCRRHGGRRTASHMEQTFVDIGHIGDKLHAKVFADFAYHLMMYHLPPVGVAGLVGCDLHALNIPAEDEYIAAYCRHTGQAQMPNLHFYLVFNLF